MPSRLRQYTFGHYVNDEGEDARVCCCDNDIYDNYRYDLGWNAEENPNEYCNDKRWDGYPDRPWHDANGWTCRTYHYGNLCTSDGKKTDAWNQAEWGSIQENAATPKGDSLKMHAFDACCACGGGDATPNYVVIPLHFFTKIYKHCKWGYIAGNAKCWNRLKQRLANIQHISDYDNVDPAHQHYVQELYIYATQRSYDESNFNDMKQVWNEFMSELGVTNRFIA